MRALLLGCTALLAACTPDARASGEVPPAGSRPSQAWTTAPGQLVLAWVIPEGDLLSCATAAHDVRQVVGRYRGRVDVRVLAVGDRQDLVRSYLRSERLEVLPVTRLSHRDFRAIFQVSPTPSVLLFRGDSILGRVAADREALLSGGGTSRLRQIVEAQLVPPALPEAPTRS